MLICLHMHCVFEVCLGGYKKVSDSLEVELKTLDTVWELRLELDPKREQHMRLTT